MSRRHSFRRDGVTLSYVDFGPAGAAPLLALHGRSGCARNFAPLARLLAPEYRMVALDQRGHGWSDHAEGSRDAMVADAAAFLREISPDRPAALLGHSMGGVTAFLTAGRHPDLVSKVIVEDIGARPPKALPPPPAEPWPLRWETLKEMLDFIAASPFGLDRFFLDSIAEFEDGWGFRFTDAWYFRWQKAMSGDFSAEWARVACPILLIHGRRSWALDDDEARRMIALNAKARLAQFDAAHVIHDEKPAEFAATVRAFLE